MRPLIALLVMLGEKPDAGNPDGGTCVHHAPKPGPGLGTTGDQAYYVALIDQLDKRCGKDAYKVEVGMTFERVKSCSMLNLDVDPGVKVPNGAVYTFWDDWNGGCGQIRVVNGKVTQVTRSPNF